MPPLFGENKRQALLKEREGVCGRQRPAEASCTELQVHLPLFELPEQESLAGGGGGGGGSARGHLVCSSLGTVFHIDHGLSAEHLLWTLLIVLSGVRGGPVLFQQQTVTNPIAATCPELRSRADFR